MVLCCEPFVVAHTSGNETGFVKVDDHVMPVELAMCCDSGGRPVSGYALAWCPTEDMALEVQKICRVVIFHKYTFFMARLDNLRSQYHAAENLLARS